MTQDPDRTVDKYDRQLGLLDGLPGMVHTKPVTLRVVPPMGVGGSTTYVVQTWRQAGERIESDDPTLPDKRTPATFTVFLEIVEGDRPAFRHALPHDVTQLIVRQRDALTSQANKRAAKQAAATRKARGIVPDVAAMRAGRKKAK